MSARFRQTVESFPPLNDTTTLSYRSNSKWMRSSDFSSTLAASSRRFRILLMGAS